ncbi:MAG: DUF3891 family protein [Ardenticatenia bacterium]|nr:DUF3891 family protein [Ardenticatenia bacterium]
MDGCAFWPLANTTSAGSSGRPIPASPPQGIPCQFTELAVDEHLTIWRRGVEWALRQHPLIALLVSRHATTLYASRQVEDERISAFLAEQRRLQQHLEQALNLPLETIDDAYRLLRLMDWCSLALCLERYRQGPVDLGTGPGGIPLTLTSASHERLTVRPWPFDVERFTVEVPVRRLERRTFEGDGDLQQTLHQVPLAWRHWELVRA